MAQCEYTIQISTRRPWFWRFYWSEAIRALAHFGLLWSPVAWARVTWTFLAVCIWPFGRKS